MRLSILWRIMEIEEGVIRRGRSLIIPSLKTWLKHAYFHQSIDVKFIFDSARLGLFSFANVLQIADVTLRVVFLQFLPYFYLLFRVFLTLETSEMAAIFVSTTKTTQPRPQVKTLHFWRHFLAKHKILPNLVIGNWLWWIMRVLLANQNRGNILNE